jgi:toxin YoeB
MAERKIIWTQEASISLIEILSYFVERNKSKTYSVKLKTEIKKTVNLLSKQPLLGKETDFEGVRELIHEVYQIYYRVSEQEISILLVWDGRRNPDDLTKLFKD